MDSNGDNQLWRPVLSSKDAWLTAILVVTATFVTAIGVRFEAEVTGKFFLARILHSHLQTGLSRRFRRPPATLPITEASVLSIRFCYTSSTDFDSLFSNTVSQCPNCQTLWRSNLPMKHSTAYDPMLLWKSAIQPYPPHLSQLGSHYRGELHFQGHAAGLVRESPQKTNYRNHPQSRQLTMQL